MSDSQEQLPPLARIGLNAHKAGMEGLDKGKINEIIVEASKGSRYYQNEVRKEQEVVKRVNCMKRDLQGFTAMQKAAAMKSANREMEELELSRDLSHFIVHVDMDAFYAAVEMRDNPSLKELPIAVGSNSMLSTSNYVARRFGVRAAMPGFIAKKLCPDLVIVPPNFEKYHKVSEDMRRILLKYDPNFSMVGLDESYLDLTDYVKCLVDETASNCNDDISGEFPLESKCSLMYQWNLADKVVNNLRSDIFEHTGLTASAGLAPNKMLAKIASDMRKPNGQFMVEPTRDGIMRFIHDLPIRKVCGIGKVTEKILNALEITVCSHLYQKRDVLHLAFSPRSSRFFLSVSLGLGDVDQKKSSDKMSIGIERSFCEINDPVQLMEKCSELCKILAEDMEKQKIEGRTVTIKLKTIDFAVKFHGSTVSKVITSYEKLFDVACGLLQQEIQACKPGPLRLRLLGIKVSSLVGLEVKCSSQETLKTFLKPARHMGLANQKTSCQFANSTITSLSSTTVTVVCPICSSEICTDNSGLNQHIDLCLNRGIVMEVIGSNKLNDDCKRTCTNCDTSSIS